MARKGVRTNTEIQAFLPDWEYQDSKDFPGYLVMRCPREDCPSAAENQPDGIQRVIVVHKETLLGEMRSRVNPDVVLRGRSCPYCYGTAAVPVKAGRITPPAPMQRRRGTTKK